MADADAAASSDCWTEGLQAGNEAQSEFGCSEREDASSFLPLQNGPSSSAVLSFLKKGKISNKQIFGVFDEKLLF